MPSEQRLSLGRRVAAAGEQVWGPQGRSEPGVPEEPKGLPVLNYSLRLLQQYCYKHSCILLLRNTFPLGVYLEVELQSPMCVNMCVSQGVLPVHFSASSVKSSSHSVSLSTLASVCRFHFSHSGGCSVITLCGCNLYLRQGRVF